ERTGIPALGASRHPGRDASQMKTSQNNHQPHAPLVNKEMMSWMLTGLFAGLGMMAKYYTITLVAGMALFLILHAENRKRLATFPPYLGLAIFILVCFPHIVWLFYHDFITVRYVVDRGSSVPSWMNHFIYPLTFIWQQGEALLPVIIPLSLLLIGKKPQKNPL